MSLLISTHALPILSYRIPEHLSDQVRAGAAVAAPLSGYTRLGIIVEVTERGENSREYIREVAQGLSIPPALAEVCRRLSERFVVPQSNVLRAALPPGLNTGQYQIVEPAPGWPWKADSMVGRTALRRVLGGEGLKVAENEGRLRFAVSPPEQKLTEWAVVLAGVEPDLGRAPRQQEVYESLVEFEHGRPTSVLLSDTGASRSILKSLERRGAIRLENRAEPPPIVTTRGSTETGNLHVDLRGYSREAGRAVDRGGAWSWRVPQREQAAAVAAFAAAALEGGEQTLILVPEVENVGHLLDYLADHLPGGYKVAPYHSGLDKRRSVVYEKSRSGEVDVLVGTRTAALIPMDRLGAVCVVDEPDRSHRAEAGYEGLPIHARDIALERCRAEGCSVLFLSPTPSLRISAPESDVQQLPSRRERSWPAARIVDMRGSGAALSSALITLCRKNLEDGKRTAVVSNRLGYATSVSCNRCGAVQSCPNCDLPLALRESSETLTCGRCGYEVGHYGRCETCGSERVSPTGLATDRLREDLTRALDAPVGKLTAGSRELEDSPVVVATARFVIGDDWDAVVVADADALLLGSSMSSVERAFRILYGAAAAARDLILVQTRSPEHYALRAALRGDYPSFAAAELPRLRASDYPPYGHLAVVVLEGAEETVRGAVESQLRPSLELGVSMSDPIPPVRSGEKPVWRVLLRASEPLAVARSAALAVRLAAKTCGASKLKARVEIDPEEV